LVLLRYLCHALTNRKPGAPTVKNPPAIRLVVGLVVMTAGITALFAPAGAAGYITITQTTVPSSATCLDPATAMHDGKLTPYPVSDTSTFKVTIPSQTRLCPPVDAWAVVYKMPGGGQQWPQTFVEKQEIKIADAGDTVVTFAKQCDPVQFDIVTGPIPQTL